MKTALKLVFGLIIGYGIVLALWAFAFDWWHMRHNKRNRM